MSEETPTAIAQAGAYFGDGGCGVVGLNAPDAELPGADVLVIAAPLTSESTFLIDARRLALLPAGAIVVNVARGRWCPTRRCWRRCSGIMFVVPC